MHAVRGRIHKRRKWNINWRQREILGLEIFHLQNNTTIFPGAGNSILPNYMYSGEHYIPYRRINKSCLFWLNSLLVSRDIH